MPVCLWKKEGKSEDTRCAQLCWWVSVSAEVTKYPINEDLNCYGGTGSEYDCRRWEQDGLFHGTLEKCLEQPHASSKNNIWAVKNTSVGQNLSYGWVSHWFTAPWLPLQISFQKQNKQKKDKGGKKTEQKNDIVGIIAHDSEKPVHVWHLRMS